ncbi:hypothetical protein B0H13DRAFT_2329170 [Mycena leptocephala]|nr:hypothetical protein B0H13DRAFT_2329170 [Mycena leptocephala]
MYPVTLSSSFPRLAFLLLTAVLTGVNAQESTYPATPLVSKHFAYPTGIPYQADTDPNLIRGSQQGYNLCNSTTEGQSSLCQTSFLNALDDFCLWAPPKPNSTIADTEGKKSLGVQFMRTPAYVQVVGFIDQRFIDMVSDDSGGELDPHGADFRGNPLGGLVYSTAWSNNNDTYDQVIEWHNFMGGNQFCFKACDPPAPTRPIIASTSTTASAASAREPRPISTLPYDPKVPASSSCTQYSSADLYSALGTITSSASAGASVTGAAAKSGASGSATRSGESAGASATGGTTQSGAEVLGVSLVSTVLGVVFAVVFLS